MGLNAQQIRLVQKAVRTAGLRSKNFDGRYRMLLGQYKRPNGRPVTSCKQLNNTQVDDLLAICEAHGWQYPGKPKNHYRLKIMTRYEIASFAQQSAIKHLAGDLGWENYQLNGFLKRITGGVAGHINALAPKQAYKVIEGLKAMFGRETGRQYSTLKEIQEELEVATDGKANQI